jgi:hypothetical protein
MGIRRFNEVFDDMAWWWSDLDPQVNVTWPTKKLKVYDPENYEITPRKEYKQILIKNQEQEIADIKTKLAEAEDKLKALKSG